MENLEGTFFTSIIENYIDSDSSDDNRSCVCMIIHLTCSYVHGSSCMTSYSLLSLLPYNTLYIRIQYLYNFIIHSSGVRQHPKSPTPVTTTHLMTTGQLPSLHSALIINERSITHYSLFIICISSQRDYASWFHRLSRPWKITEVYSTPTRGRLTHRIGQPCRLTLSLLPYNTLYIRIQYLYNFIIHSSGVRQHPKSPTPVTTTHLMTTGQLPSLHSALIINERSITHYSLFIICISSQRDYASWFHRLSRPWKITEVYSTPTRGRLTHRIDQPCRLTLSLLPYNTLHIRIQYL